MHFLELKLFAGFQLLDQQGKILSGISRKAKALLAWLALNPDQEYPRERLASVLWPDSNEIQARHSLRQALSSLRKLLPSDSELLKATKDWILLDGKQIEVDVQRFNQALKKGDKAALDDAIRLYQGSLLEGCNPGSDSFDDWLFSYRNNYRELAITVLEKRLVSLVSTNDSVDDEKAILYAKQLIKIDELQESAYRALMLVYHKSGNDGLALKAYQEIKDKLQQQLAISASDETEILYQKILAPHVIAKSKAVLATTSVLAMNKKRRLSNNSERLLYQVEMAINGILEHRIGYSFLIRGEQQKTVGVAKEVIQRIKAKNFIYCQKKVSTNAEEQRVLIELLEVLTIYLTDPERLACLQRDEGISLRALSMLRSLSTDQPIMILTEDIQNSEVDLMVQLANLASLIGNRAVLFIMIGGLSNNDPLEIIWQSAMIGASLTTITL